MKVYTVTSVPSGHPFQRKFSLARWQFPKICDEKRYTTFYDRLLNRGRIILHYRDSDWKAWCVQTQVGSSRCFSLVATKITATPSTFWVTGLKRQHQNHPLYSWHLTGFVKKQNNNNTHIGSLSMFMFRLRLWFQGVVSLPLSRDRHFSSTENITLVTPQNSEAPPESI